MAADGLAGILARALIGRAPYKRPPTVSQIARSAYARAGSWKKAARDLGVAESTLRAWRNSNQRPTPRTLEKIRERHAEVLTERVRTGNTDDETVVVSWRFDGRDRTTRGKNLKLRDGTMRAAQNALMKADNKGAVLAFLEGIRDPWYQAHFTAYQLHADQGDYVESAADLSEEASAPLLPDDLEQLDHYEDYPDAYDENDAYEFEAYGVA